MRIVLATRNPAKVREISAILAPMSVTVSSLDEVDPAGAIVEPPETASSFAANAAAKAEYYARATGCWALADDSGLEVDALGGAPGVRSARYAADEFSPGASPPRERMDQASNRKLLRELADVDEDRRTARFVCCLSLSDGHEVILEARGVLEGRIGRRPAGRNGFGYDPLFYVPPLGQTTAQLAPDEKNRISHRGQAVRQFAKRLAELLADRKAPPPCAN